MFMDAEIYLWVKAVHVILVIAWMAGMFYLPRLFVYHTRGEKGSELSETLKIMERKLLRMIITPAMFASWISGIWMLTMLSQSGGWLWAKIALLILMEAFYLFLVIWQRRFWEDKNEHSEKFYRVANEVPTLLVIGIVILAIIKPF